jgi:glycosyltransferase involved in cell wall biosynthesis
MKREFSFLTQPRSIGWLSDMTHSWPISSTRHREPNHAILGPKILHVVAGSDYGGGSRVIADLGAAADRAGFRVSVLTTDPRLKRALIDVGIGVIDGIHIPRAIAPILDTAALVRLVRQMRRDRYDIVHTHTTKGGLIGRLAAYFAGVPVVVHTAHGFSFHEQSGRLSRRLEVWVERFLARLSTTIVTVSDHHRDIGLSAGIADPQKLVSVPNGIRDPGVASHRDVPSYHGIDSFVILCHGRLAPQKGVTYLLQALAALPESERRMCRVQLAGEGELADELEMQAQRLGIIDQVEFLGFRTDVLALLERADLVVLPSLWEGLSISLLEAMATGKPIVTTTISSNLEVVANAACVTLVPAGDPLALAEAIGFLMRSPVERDRLADRARQRYLSAYAVDRMCDAYLHIYRTAVPR